MRRASPEGAKISGQRGVGDGLKQVLYSGAGDPAAFHDWAFISGRCSAPLDNSLAFMLGKRQLQILAATTFAVESNKQTATPSARIA